MESKSMNTDRIFITEEGDFVDVIEHTRKQLQDKQGLKVYVSTDSQNNEGRTFYATVVVYRYGIRGCHYISKSVDIPAIKAIYPRLVKEAEFTIAAAQLIDSEVPVEFEALEFDYNGRIKTESTKAIEFAKGWAASLGYNPVVKPGPMIASKAGDRVCRKDLERYKHKK